MAGGEPRLGTTATYMRHNDHGATHLSTKIDRLHDRLDNEYEVFSAGSVKKWSKFGLSGPVVGDEPGKVREALASSPRINTVILRRGAAAYPHRARLDA